MPLPDGEEFPAVLQCLLPEGRKLSSEQGALLRWMASQLSSGLKRLRLERRDQLLASYLLSSGEILLGVDRNGTITHANAAAERELDASAGRARGREARRVGLSRSRSRGGLPLRACARFRRVRGRRVAPPERRVPLPR